MLLKCLVCTWKFCDTVLNVCVCFTPHVCVHLHPISEHLCAFSAPDWMKIWNPDVFRSEQSRPKRKLFNLAVSTWHVSRSQIEAQRARWWLAYNVRAFLSCYSLHPSFKRSPLLFFVSPRLSSIHPVSHRSPHNPRSCWKVAKLLINHTYTMKHSEVWARFFLDASVSDFQDPSALELTLPQENAFFFHSISISMIPKKVSLFVSLFICLFSISQQRLCKQCLGRR